jgi:hypothetical protein
MLGRITLLFFALSAGVVTAQPTYDEVYNILQANCVTGCHGGANPDGNLDLSSTNAAVYNSLFNVDPTNPAAAAKGMKLIFPGETEKSFLYQKINKGLYDHMVLDTQEGGAMPPASTLAPEERELVYQWIQAGAPQTGTVINKQMLVDYYNGQGMVALPSPPPPPAGTGTQVYFGSVFLQPNDEVEYMLKRRLNINYDSEVNRLETFFDGSSHHYIIYKIIDSTLASGFQDGLDEVTGFNDAFPPNSKMVMAWQYPYNVNLPNETGYFWEANPYLLLNFHVRNYSPDSILKAHVYTNIYHEPRKLETIEMVAELVPNADPFFFVPSNGQNVTFTDEWVDQNSNSSRYIWMLSSHTHKYGVDYDIFERNSDGSKGTQLYEGYFNSDYSFNQGFYDWEHPATRYFEPLLENVKANGLIHEATYNNTGQFGVGWGLTTQDEMMLIFVQYTNEKPEPAGIDKIDKSPLDYVLYPNPNNGQFALKMSPNLKDKLLNLEIFSLDGKLIYNTQLNGNQANDHLQLSNIAQGTYLIKLSDGEVSKVQKFTINR